MSANLTILKPRLYVTPAGPGHLTEKDLLNAILLGKSVEYRDFYGKPTAVKAERSVDLVNAINEQDDSINATLVRAYAHGPAALYKAIGRLMKKEIADDLAFYNDRDGRIVEE
ncbi:hypothetical protein GNZ10_13690 [Ralstonia sp. 3N]|uniref:hypothetical protein n=1 Tax=Ralstonia sp. 3N TaxID=2675750 RepID=UPI0015C56BD3|nr:hypothetical protein [Ralstonia sp. 3N]NPT50749.1 hypothetical protein [Ralstonia sp. 3N]